MLRLLSLLQTHRYWPGGELAGRLEVSPRTLRRDIDRLRERGYTVDAVRGVAGGYQLRAGGQLPPLLLEDDEAVTIAVALRTAASGAVAGMEETAIQALTKVIGVMPPRLRHRMDAVHSQTDGVPWAGGPTLDAGVLTTLAQACRDDEPISFAYVARVAGARHQVEPYRLVCLGRRWYLVAYDRERQDWRSFRVDRISAPRASGQRFRPRELPAQDAPAFVRAGIRSMAQRYQVRVRFATDAATVAAYVDRWATVEPDGPEACRMVMATDTLDWPMMVLSRLDAEFTVEGPEELRDLVAASAGRFARATAAPSL